MEKHRQYGFMFIFCIVICLGLVSFVSCVIAETKKSKRKDLKVDGKLCYLPGSQAYGFGIAASICLSIAQLIGNLIICSNFCSREKGNSFKTRKPRIATALVIFSWISFGIAVILISGATSMSREQPYGRGWLDRECYLVKDGVYIGSGGLVLASLGSILAAATVTIKKSSQVEQGRRIHAQK